MKVNSKQHDKLRELSERYQSYIGDVWTRIYSSITKADARYNSVGSTINFFETQEEQYKIGESEQGIEVKYDRMSAKTGNIYIEIKECRFAGSKLVPSGIYRKDNTVTWIIGNYKSFYIIPKEELVKYHISARPKEIVIKQATSAGFIIPMSSLDKWVDQGRALKVDVKLEIAASKQKSYYIDYLNNNYYITYISLTKQNNNMTTTKQQPTTAQSIVGNFELTGALNKVSIAEEVGKNKLLLRKFTIMDLQNPGKEYEFVLFGENVGMIEPYKYNQHITVTFNIHTNRYKDSIYTSLKAFRIREATDSTEALQEIYDNAQPNGEYHSSKGYKHTH